MKSNESHYIPATKDKLASVGHLCKCDICGRKIYVSMGLIGTPHHFGVAAMCAECLQIEDGFKQQYPDIAKQIEDWKNGDTT